MATGADLPVHVSFHEQLEHGFGDGSQKIVFAGLFQQGGQRHSVLGVRFAFASGPIGLLLGSG
jgi:hypothetical protein